MKKYIFFALLSVCGLLPSCYSFKGTSIDPEIDTFFVNRFDLQLVAPSASAPPNLAFDFTEQLKDKIRNQTRLSLVNENPDIEFSGYIKEYNVVPVAPQADEIVELNQLWITVVVNYQNNQEGKSTDKWTHQARQFAEFSNSQDLLSVQDALIAEINDRLLDDIINKAFNDW